MVKYIPVTNYAWHKINSNQSSLSILIKPTKKYVQQLCYSKKESLHQKGDAWIKFDNTYCIAFNLNGNQEKLERISFFFGFF